VVVRIGRQLVGYGDSYADPAPFLWRSAHITAQPLAGPAPSILMWVIFFFFITLGLELSDAKVYKP